MSSKSKAKTRTDQTNEVAKFLGIDYAGALDVIYLRSRPRWTKKLEEELIKLHKAGTPPNMETFGCREGSKEKIYAHYSPRNKPIDEMIIGHNRSPAVNGYGTFRFIGSR